MIGPRGHRDAAIGNDVIINHHAGFVTEQGAIARATRDEFSVATFVHHSPGIEHDHAVGQSHGGRAMCNQDRCAAGHHRPQRSMDRFLGRGVHRRRRVIKHQNAWVAHDRSRQGNALALAARECETAFTNDGVDTLGKCVDERFCTGDARSGSNLFGRGVGPTVRDVVADRVGEQERFLKDHADGGAKRCQRHVAHIDTVDADSSRTNVVKARQECRHRRLTRTASANERYDLARRNVQRKSIDHWFSACVAKGDVVKHHIARNVARIVVQFGRISTIGDLGVHIKYLQHASCAGARLLQRGDHDRHHPNRCDELHEIRGEREERAEAEMPTHRQPPAEREYRNLRERWHCGKRRRGSRLQTNEANPRPIQRGRRCGEALDLAIFRAEALHDAHTGDSLINNAGHFSGALLRFPGRREHRGAQLQRNHRHQREGHDHDERQHRREHKHHRQRQHEQHDVAEHDRQEREELLDQAKIARCPRDELPGSQTIVAGEVEAHQPIEDCRT